MERSIKIINKLGLHVRPAAQLSELANKYKASLTVTKDGYSVNGKSIMELLTLAANEGVTLNCKSDGDDAEQLLNAVEALISAKFNED